MQMIAGALPLILALLSPFGDIIGVSALELRHSSHAQHHGPPGRHDKDSWRRPISSVSLMQGKVDILKSNNTDKSTAIAPKSSVPSWTAASAESQTVSHTSGLFSQARHNVDWNVKLGKERTAVLMMWATTLLMGIALCLALGAVALLLCCVYDVTAHCLHRARFRQCQAKVQHVHEAFASKSGELPVCPYCVEKISVKRGPNKVVFLCGHRFHVECSNTWFSENPDQATHCPICRDVEPELDLCKERCGCASAKEQKKACEDQLQLQSDQAAGPKLSHEEEGSDGSHQSVDGAMAFMLQSLHRCYPEIINKECVERWLTCNTEIWVSELTCPRYNSILRKNKGAN